MNSFSLIVFYFLINARDLFIAADSDVARLQAMVKIVNYWTHTGLQITVVVIVI